MSICKDCIHYEICSPYVAPNESFPEVEGGCRCFKAKADVVEVVRCKDCKHYGGVVYGGVCRKYSGYETKVCTEKDHYCSYGERKDEAIRSAIEEWNGKRDKSCDTCAFYNEDRDNQPCCYCAENSCWVKGEEDET